MTRVGLWSRFFKSDKQSKDIAKQRLHAVLVSDRVNVAPEMLEELKIRLADVVSEFAIIDAKNLQIKLEQGLDSEVVALLTTVPIKQLKRRS